MSGGLQSGAEDVLELVFQQCGVNFVHVNIAWVLML